MKRGEIWTVSGGADFTGKPRPAVVMQDDTFDATTSVTICPLTTDPTKAQLLRPIVTPSKQNGLSGPSRAMVDKSRRSEGAEPGIELAALPTTTSPASAPP